MTLHKEIEHAIGAHGLWKGRLKLAIDAGKSDLDPNVVCSDRHCDFGKWLYGPGAAGKSAHYEKVRKLHADFHTEAGRVLRLAMAGHKPDAAKALDQGSVFAHTSGALTGALMAWAKDTP